MGWGTPQVQTYGGVQSAAVLFDEGHDGAVGIAAGDDSKNREQQDMLQLVELTLGPARVGDIAEQAEQLIERSHGNLLAVWLPCIDSKNSPRRNPPPGTAGMICATCSGADSTYPLSCIERLTALVVRGASRRVCVRSGTHFPPGGRARQTGCRRPGACAWPRASPPGCSVTSAIARVTAGAANGALSARPSTRRTVPILALSSPRSNTPAWPIPVPSTRTCTAPVARPRTALASRSNCSPIVHSSATT